MADTKLPKLIERLLKLTENGKIDWKATADENDFQAVVGQYVVTVSRTRNRDGWDTWDFAIRVADWKGTALDEGVASGGSQLAEVNSEVPYSELARLFDGARRKALNVDEALTELLSSLDSL